MVAMVEILHGLQMLLHMKLVAVEVERAKVTQEMLVLPQKAVAEVQHGTTVVTLVMEEELLGGLLQ